MLKLKISKSNKILKKSIEKKILLIFVTFFKFFNFYNFFTSKNSLSNIFCFYFRRNFFDARNRFNFVYLIQVNSLTLFHVVFVSNLSRLSFFITLSITSKFITNFVDLHRRFNLMHSSHFFCFVAQRIYIIIAIKFRLLTRTIKSLNFVN